MYIEQKSTGTAWGTGMWVGRKKEGNLTLLKEA